MAIGVAGLRDPARSAISHPEEHPGQAILGIAAQSAREIGDSFLIPPLVHQSHSKCMKCFRRLVESYRDAQLLLGRSEHSQVQVGRTKCKTHIRLVRRQIQGFSERHNSSGEIAPIRVICAQLHVGPVVVRTAGDGGLKSYQSLSLLVVVFINLAEPPVVLRIVRFQLNGTAVLCRGLLVEARVRQMQARHTMHRRQIQVAALGLPGRIGRPVKPRVLLGQEVLEPLSFGQAGIGQRGVGIGLGRAFERRQRLGDCAVTPQVGEASQVIPTRGCVHRRGDCKWRQMERLRHHAGQNDRNVALFRHAVLRPPFLKVD